MKFTVLYLMLPFLLSIHLLLKQFGKYKKGKTVNYVVIFLSVTVLLSSVTSIILTLAGIK